jgi:hypothetical protein
MMSIKLGGPVTFGAFMPGEAKDYLASTTLTATSSAPAAALTVSDRSATATGHLVNGTVALPQALQVNAGGPFAPLGGSGSPTLLKTWSTPAANDVVQLEFKQSIAATDRLLAGTYGKRVTFTLSATTP